MEAICPVCNNTAPVRLTKEGIDYFQCESCKMLFCQPLDQDGLVGGQHEEGRAQQNDIRLSRVVTMLEGANRKEARILDFGTGHGLLPKHLMHHGYNVDGYDAYNEEFSKIPENGAYDLVMCVECIEHTSPPFIEIDFIRRKLKKNGLFYIETGFVDIASDDGIELDDYFYIAPHSGHSTIFSHHSLDLLLFLKGFRSRKHFDRNTRLYSKI